MRADHVRIVDFLLSQTSRLCEKRELTGDSPKKELVREEGPRCREATREHWMERMFISFVKVIG